MQLNFNWNLFEVWTPSVGSRGQHRWLSSTTTRFLFCKIATKIVVSAVLNHLSATATNIDVLQLTKIMLHRNVVYPRTTREGKKTKKNKTQKTPKPARTRRTIRWSRLPDFRSSTNSSVLSRNLNFKFERFEKHCTALVYVAGYKNFIMKQILAILVRLWRLFKFVVGIRTYPHG